jgi:hypothetical protein
MPDEQPTPGEWILILLVIVVAGLVVFFSPWDRW